MSFHKTRNQLSNV